jgi:hypothetical protein
MAAFGPLPVPDDSACRTSAQPVPRARGAGGEAALGGSQQPLYRPDGGHSHCLAETGQPEGGSRTAASELGRDSRDHGTGGGARLGAAKGREDSQGMKGRPQGAQVLHPGQPSERHSSALRGRGSQAEESGRILAHSHGETERGHCGCSHGYVRSLWEFGASAFGGEREQDRV